MDAIVGPGIAMEMEVAAEEEVLTQEDAEAKVDLKTHSDVAVCQNPVSQDFANESSSEHACYSGDSSEDEYSCDDLKLHMGAWNKADNMRPCFAKDGCLCWECGKLFQSLTALMHHFRTHKTQVHCNICQVTFRRMVSLSMHLENVHNNIVLFCTACHLFFDSKWDLNKHLEEHLDLESLPLLLGSPSRSDSHKKTGTGLSELARNLSNSELFVQSSTSVIKEDLKESYNQDSRQEINDLHTSAVQDPVRNSINGSSPKKKNGIVTTTYALRMRHTKTLTKVFPRESLPESAHKKKIQLFVFRSVDRSHEGAQNGAEVKTDDEEKKREEDDEDVKPDASSLNPPLSDSLSSSDSTGLSTSVKQEDVVSDNMPPTWEGAPLEESQLDDSLEENPSGEENTLPSWDSATDSDSKSDDVSDSSMSSFSSSSSSDSSYCPNRRARRTRLKRTKRVVVDRKRKIGLLPTPAFTPEAPIACPRGDGPYETPNHLQRHEAVCGKKVACCTDCNAAFPDDVALLEHKARVHPSVKPSCMYACDSCREVFPTLAVYRHHQCPLKTASSTQSPTRAPPPALVSASVPTPAFHHISRTVNHSVGPASLTRGQTAPSAVLSSSRSHTAASTVMRVDPVPSSSSHIAPPGCSVTVADAMRVTVPGSVQNSATVSPGCVPSGSGFSLPRIMLPGTSQSGSRPIMATVVYSGSGATGRVAHVVFQSQALTTPAATLTQSVSQNQPLGLSAAPAQAHPVNHAPSFSSLQLTNLLVKGIIQPSTLIRPPQPSAMTAAPLSAPSSVSAPLPNVIPHPIFISVPAPLSVPLCSQSPVSVPVPKPAPVSVPLLVPKAAPGGGTLPISSPVQVPPCGPVPPGPAFLQAATPVTVQNSLPGTESLRILGLYVNCSQEFALQQRLEKSWRSKGVFLCRQCGAVSRQPSLCVRHRYLHRGSRPYRCHCGRTFLRRLHLLRHHIQHAEATRFVCAPCGQTFSGARDLARHKRGWRGTGRRRAKVRKDCRAPFYCDCGQFFQRPAAFLWHKLKNPDGLKRL
ncbi:hypothetical protein GN956_G5066 [Arapaima gigas]